MSSIINYADGEHTYRDYYNDHPDEGVSWCDCYVASGDHAVCVGDEAVNEINQIMINGKSIDSRDGTSAVKRLAETVNSDYLYYDGWSYTHIAIDAMQKVGCASCPWFAECQQMDEIL